MRAKGDAHDHGRAFDAMAAPPDTSPADGRRQAMSFSYQREVINVQPSTHRRQVSNDPLALGVPQNCETRPATAVAWHTTDTAVSDRGQERRGGGPHPTAVGVRLPCDRSRRPVSATCHFFEARPWLSGYGCASVFRARHSADAQPTRDAMNDCMKRKREKPPVRCTGGLSHCCTLKGGCCFMEAAPAL